MSAWHARITGYGEEDPTTLTPNPHNWRLHPPHQEDALTGVLDQVGWVQQVIVNRTTGYMLDGHLRQQVAIRRGEASIPVAYVELAEDEEALALAALDPLGTLAATDGEAVLALLADIDEQSGAVQALLDDLRHGADALASGGGDNQRARRQPDEDDPALGGTVMLKIPPETFKRYRELLAVFPASDEAASFGLILSAVDLDDLRVAA